MNEEAIKDAYSLFVGTGYKKSYEEFKQLMASNPDALNDAYNLFVGTGYKKDVNSFRALMGADQQQAPAQSQAPAQPQDQLKKKEESVIMGSLLGDSSLASQKQTPDYTVDQITGVKRIKDIYAGAEVKQNPEFYDKAMKQITPEFIDQIEEVVVPQMNYQFGPMGFKFEESGMTGDWMIATAPNGKTKEFSLDPSFGIGATSTSEELKRWIKSNTPVDGLKTLESQYIKGNKKYATEEEYRSSVAQMNKEAEDFKLSSDTYFYELSQVDKQLGQNISEDVRRELLLKKKNLDVKREDLLKRQQELAVKSKDYESSIGQYMMMRAEQGQDWGAFLNSVLTGLSTMGATTAVNIMADIGGEFTEFKPYKEKATSILLARDLGIEAPLDLLEKLPEGMSQQYAVRNDKAWEDWYNSLDQQKKDLLSQKYKDKVKKEAKYGKDGEMGTLEAVRNSYRTAFGSASTEEYKQKRSDESLLAGALFGVGESIPAMMGGVTQRGVQLFSQGVDAIYREMEKNPEFENISENEKLLIATPIGVAIAKLESLGFSNVIANKGLTNRIILSALGKAGSTTTAKTFGELVQNEIESMGGKFLLTATGAALAEAETGLAQQVTEYAFKDFYNSIKEKDLFKTPEFLSSEYLSDIGKAAVSEAIGGLVLGLPGSVSAAYSKKGYLNMSDEMFESFEMFSKDNNLQSAFIVDLKNKISRGDMTSDQAKEVLNNYRNSVGLLRELPDGLTLTQKKEAMNLLKEKRDLKQQITGKDEALVKRQNDRISEINELLNNLSDNAIQESSTEGVLPRQQGEATEAGSERGQMGQGVQGQETTQAGTQERLGVLSSPETVTMALEQLPQGERMSAVFEQEDGTETPVMGNEKMLANLYAIAREVSEQDRTPQQRSVVDAVEVSLKTLIDQEIEDQQMPQGPDDEISSLNDDQVYVFTAQNMEGVPEQFRESAEVVPATEVKGRKRFLGLIPYGKEETRTVSDEVVRYSITGREAKAAYAQIVAANPQMRPEVATTKATIAQNVAKSVASIFPNLKVTTHKNGEEMRSFAEKNFGSGVSAQVLGDEGGMIIYDANNNPVAIMVNDEVDDPTTLPHEAWHGILIKAFGQDENLFTEFKDGIKKRLIDNGFTEIADQLDEFSASEEYINSDSQSEEWLVQLGGLLTASGISSDNLTPKAKTLLQQIKDVFNDVARKITGSPIFLEDATPDDILDFMVAISDRMRRGETIADFFKESEGKTGGARVKSQRPLNIRLEPIDFENESENIDVYDASEKASQIAKNNGVNILRGKDLKSVAVDDNDDIVGGLWTEISGDEFSFDVAINKEYQRKGIGEELVNEAIYEFKAQDFDDTLKYKIDVTNPAMEKLLSKYGFEVVERYEGHAIMEHPTNNPKLKSETKSKFQRPGAATLQEIKKIAQRYNINDKGFAPKQVDEKALARELAPLGYSARRARPTADGYGGGAFITNARGIFFNPFKAKKQRPRKAGMLNVDPASIEGYDQMVTILDDLVRKRKERGDSDQDIASKLMDVIATLPAYQNATDIQREAMVRGIRKEFGLKESPSPSVAKILGTLKDVKKITMSEKELLKKQFRDQARGARDAKRAWMLASKELAKGIKELRGKGKISVAQAANIISRFSKVNVFDQESIDRFVDYMTNVIQDAEYSAKITRAKSLLPRARKNIKTKIGDAQEVAQDLKKLFAIDPSMIPSQYIDTYMSMLESFGEKAAVLDLKDISTVASDVSDILNEINNEVSIAEEMAERFAYADKVYDDDGNLLYADTVSEMLDQGLITAKESDIMRKYRSIISPVERVQKTEQELEQEKADTISAILRSVIDPASLALEDEVILAKKIALLLKPALLNRLPLSKLENIARLIENINNGYMPHFGALVYERLSSFENSIEGVQSVKEAKPIKLSKMYASLKSKLTGKGAILEMIRRSPLYFLDQVFGDFKSKRLFNSLFKGMAEGNDLFKASIDAINKRLDNAHDAVAKSRGYKINEAIMSSYRMMTYMLQNEYLSNPDSDQVKSAMDYLKKTIEVLESEGTKVAIRKAEMLQEIIDKYSTGSDIDMTKLLDSFNLAELEAIETISDINNELSEKAVYTAAVIRGKRIDPLVNYVHHMAIPEIKLGEIDSATQMASQYNASISPSSRAMNLQDRKNKVVPLNFDVFASAQRGAKFTLLDYHMTMPIRIARKTVNQMRADLKEPGSTAEQKRIMNALDSAVDEVIANVLTNNFITDGFVEKALNFVSKQGYRAVLASAPRFVSELTSNMAFATILDQKSFRKGAKYGGFLMSEDAVSFMKNVKSKMTTRLYHGNTLGGRLIDQSILSQTSGVKSAEPVGDIQNVANMIYNISLKKYKNLVEVVADSLISTPDKMVMRPAWFGSFATEFNRQTGKDPDMEKISSGDENYMSTYADAIEAAKTFADDRSVTVGASDNPFMGILKGTVKPNQNALVKGFNNFNNYMTRFTIYEYVAARQGIYAAMGNGSISRRDGAAMLAAVVTRMTVYSMLTNVLGSAMLSMFSDEDEEDEKTIMQKFGQALASTMSSLIVGRDFGNATKAALSYGVEEINDEVLTDLRNGEYDPYKDAITFSPFPKDGKLDIGKILVAASGSYSTSLKTLDLAVRKLLEEPKKEAEAIERVENEINVRIPLELLGNVGMVPLYKDIRKIVMDQMYKDLETADKKAADKKQTEKEMLHGYENKSDMKRYNPELYEEVFGKKSSTYNADQAKKKVKKQKEDLERRRKDDFYDYVPKKNKAKGGFGSDKFGPDKENGGFGSDKFGPDKKKKGGFGSDKFGE